MLRYIDLEHLPLQRVFIFHPKHKLFNGDLSSKVVMQRSDDVQLQMVVAHFKTPRRAQGNSRSTENDSMRRTSPINIYLFI